MLSYESRMKIQGKVEKIENISGLRWISYVYPSTSLSSIRKLANRPIREVVNNA